MFERSVKHFPRARAPPPMPEVLRRAQVPRCTSPGVTLIFSCQLKHPGDHADIDHANL